jgi:glyoxylase-like metal-dependent hydrolase (beta-lactamase superfamily II)
MDRLIAPGLWQLDTLLGGCEEVNSVFLIEGERPCLVETGPQKDAATVLAALHDRGLGPEELAYVILTHIHLDHGGAVGEVAHYFPDARIICHPKGLRHLADPSHLVAAAGRVYGSRLDSLYGRMTAVDQDRLFPGEDREMVDLGGGRRLLLLDSPGHAKHHLGVLDESSGALLVGDAVGVKIPGGGELRPATPPDDFDLDLAINSLHKFRDVHPTQVVLTHFGPAGDPDEVISEAEDRLREWCTVAERAYAEAPTLEHIEQALRDEVSQSLDADPERRQMAHVLNGTESNAAGLLRWMQSRDQVRASQIV